MKNIQLSGALPVTGILMVTYGYNYGKKTSGLILFSWIVYKITLETGCITGNGKTSGLILFSWIQFVPVQLFGSVRSSMDPKTFQDWNQPLLYWMNSDFRSLHGIGRTHWNHSDYDVILALRWWFRGIQSEFTVTKHKNPIQRSKAEIF